MNAGRERLPRREKTRSEDAGFALDTAANALGTLIAAAVIYLVGVIAGVFTFQLFVAVLAPAGVAATVLGPIQEAADIALAPAVGADR